MSIRLQPVTVSAFWSSKQRVCNFKDKLFVNLDKMGFCLVVYSVKQKCRCFWPVPIATTCGEHTVWTKRTNKLPPPMSSHRTYISLFALPFTFQGTGLIGDNNFHFRWIIKNNNFLRQAICSRKMWDRKTYFRHLIDNRFNPNLHSFKITVNLSNSKTHNAINSCIYI